MVMLRESVSGFVILCHIWWYKYCFPTDVPGKPEVKGIPTEALIEDKDSLSVTCQLSEDDLGNPQVNHYHWRNINTSYYRDTGNNNKLMLFVVNAKQHDGSWQCQPENSVGQGQITEFKVTVNGEC
jgi:hypothetical protein